MKDSVITAQFTTSGRDIGILLQQITTADVQVCKDSWFIDDTYLRVPFSPLSRLVKRLYKRVIWLWETEGKKREETQISLSAIPHSNRPHYILLLCCQQLCWKIKHYRKRVTSEAHSNQQFRDFMSCKLHLNIQKSKKPLLWKTA